MSAVLVTGATGFIGSCLLRTLAITRPERPVIGSCREPAEPGALPMVAVGDLGADTRWTPALASVDAVVHCAARVHVMRETEADPLAAFRAVNVDGTLNLARQAAAAGVRRFIFLSTVKVHGEQTTPGRPFRASDTPAPMDAYARSKLEAEEELRKLAAGSGMDVVIIRPVLVYGPGVGGNFATLLRWLERGLPLPLGAIDNRRSLLALDNLVDLVQVCLEHPAAANRTFLASDGEDLSTPELLRRLGAARGREVWLPRLPPRLLEAGAALLGRRAVAQRLCGSLQVDIEATRSRLEWVPPLTVNEGLQRAVAPPAGAPA